MFLNKRLTDRLLNKSRLAAGLLLLASTIGVHGAGNIDRTFGTNGHAYASVGSSSVGQDIALQSDGKVVMVGYFSPSSGSNLDFAVARFNADGTLDMSFDADGKVQTDFNGSLDIAYAVAIQLDGKILVAGGTRVNDRDDFALVRYNTNGSLDTSFGTGGKVIASIGPDWDFAYSIAIQSNQSIVLAGESDTPGGSGSLFAAARFLPNGALDTSFDGDGKVTTFIRTGPGIDLATDVAIQSSDGKIVLAGSSYLGTVLDTAIVRYNTDGSLDSTFDGDGKVITQASPTGGNDRAAAVELQGDGRIVVVGSLSYSGSNDDSIAIRYNANGSLDTTFDADGIAVLSFGSLIESFYDMAIQPDGKILASGTRSNNSGSPTATDITLARINANGSLDTTFNGTGRLTIAMPPGDTAAYAVKPLPNGKILTAGYRATLGVSEFMLTRYMGDLNAADYDGDTKTDLSIYRPSNGQWWISRSSDSTNNVFTFGVSNDKIVPGDYTGDGRTDIALYRPSTGEWFVLRSEDSSYYSFNFGISTDVPTPGDYDGDGRTDPAVFRGVTRHLVHTTLEHGA